MGHFFITIFLPVYKNFMIFLSIPQVEVLIFIIYIFQQKKKKKVLVIWRE